MGEIIPGVDPREKMACDYWTKGTHFETVTKWQTGSFFLFRAAFIKPVKPITEYKIYARLNRTQLENVQLP